ncbi:hypothetical protein QPK87_05880 [Kamptonema cortianum]|nr:hypothetical protein [Geitlerinema splendidum]MDK3156103.1 hypothetical protein [Kamptonema cortianum]
MSDFATAWELCRGRFVASIQNLTPDQLNWRLHKDALTLGEAAFHFAGAEVNFAQQLTGQDLDEFGKKLRAAALDGVVNEEKPPFSPEETTWELVKKALDYGEAIMGPLVRSASPELRQKNLVSVLGPTITGDGAFARMAFHAAYHDGQAYLIKNAPGFPKG